MRLSSKILNRVTAALAVWLVAIWLYLPPAQAIQIELPSINVLADPSLSIPISQLARRFASEKNISVTTSYNSARAQSENIIAGLEADVFITARRRTLDMLKTQGLIDVYSETPVTKNRLVLATYKENPLDLILIPKLPLATLLSRTDPEFNFAIGDPSYQTSGYFALQALRKYEMAAELEPHFLFIRSPIDVHHTIAQKGGYGVIYSSEAERNPELKALGYFPEAAHKPVIYLGVVVAGENMAAARQFLQFLSSSDAQRIFRQYGFEPLGEAAAPATPSPTSESGQRARGSIVNGEASPAR